MHPVLLHTILRLDKSAPVALVLDASESAAEHWPAIAQLGAELLDNLPPDSIHGVFFLGNSTNYPPTKLKTAQAEWFTENKARASLITPVFDVLVAVPDLRVVIIGNGRIYDLPDWDGEPILERCVFVDFGQPLTPDLPSAHRLSAPSAQAVLQLIRDPVSQVELGAPSAIPVWWDNLDYRPVETATGVILRAENARQLTVRVTWLTAEAAPPTAKLTLASGKTTSALPEMCAAPPEPEWIELSAEETTLLKSALARQQFKCLLCGATHDWDTVRCLETGSILGQLVYPCLDRIRATGFVVLRLANGPARARLHRASALQLSRDSVALKLGHKICIWRFDVNTGRWIRQSDSFDQYTPLSNDTYAIVV